MGIAIDFKKNYIEYSTKISEILTESTINLFSTMFDKKVILKESAIIDIHTNDSHDISGVVNIFENDFQGTLIVSFGKEIILQLMSDCYDQKFTELDENILGGVSEVTNIIFGNFKKELNNMGYSFKMLIPSAIFGVNHKFNICSDFSKILKLTFTIDPEHDFNIYLVLSESHE